MNYNELKKKAYDLVFMRGMQQKEAAKVLGVAENTVCRWAKAWKKHPVINKPTVEMVADIMQDICRIEDNDLRNRISDKLLKIVSNIPSKI